MFFRYEKLIGYELRARGENSRRLESVIACNILNRIKRPMLSNHFKSLMLTYATKSVCRESTKFIKEIRNEDLRFKEESKPRAMLYKR